MNIFGRKSKKDAPTVAADAKGTSAPHNLRVLGVPLGQAVRNNPSFDGVPVPAIVRESLDYIALHGMHVEGVYRVSAPKSRLDELELYANTGRHNEIAFQDAHEAAGLLKRFLRQLPEHILTGQLKKQFEHVAAACRCNAHCQCSAVLNLKELLHQLPTENFQLLAFVFRHAQLLIQQETSNKMGLAAIGVLLQAILNLTRNLVKIFITNSFNPECADRVGVPLFESVDIKPYLKPKSVEELKRNPPATKEQLDDEIQKQQNLLEHLHDQIQQIRGAEDTKAKEEEMWNVQTGITLLKRRRRALMVGKEGLEDGEKSDQRRTDQDPEEEGEGSNDGMSTADMEGTALFEKQLLAVQMALRDEIADEKRQIGKLLSVLREMNESDKLVGRAIPQRTSTQNSDDGSVERPKENNGNNSNQSGGHWEEQCRAEECRREQLLGELIRYRKLCAQLRARLEQDTVLVKLKEQQQQQQTAAEAEGPMGVEPSPAEANNPRVTTRF